MQPSYSPSGNQSPVLSKRKRADLASRGILFLVAVGAALVLAFGTDLGDAINDLQAGGSGGLYSPKLTMLILMLICAVPATLIYFMVKVLLINRLPDN